MMSVARERILGAVRRSLRRAGPLPESVRDGLNRRLAAPIPNLKPALAEDPISLFARKANAVHTRISTVPTLAGVSEVVVRHIEENGLGDEIVAAPELEGMQWSNRLIVERRAAGGSDRLSVTGAFAGIAETGSVMLLSGPKSPTTLNFLPEDHIVVLRESRIVPHLEDAWVLLREERNSMPRTVNIICGPYLRSVEDRRCRTRNTGRRPRPAAVPCRRRAGMTGLSSGERRPEALVVIREVLCKMTKN